MRDGIERIFSVAPMMGWTDRHERYFLRLLSRRALLYTEMINPNAILFGKRERFLRFHPSEHPVAIQLGGSDPEKLAEAAAAAEESGFDEVNLNVGCPSDKASQGTFGACLMAQPELVARCLQAMSEAVKIPVTIKTRIGIDRQDTYEPLRDFVVRVLQSGVTVFIVHARKAWLDGLSPKENRHKPPLRYEYVYRLKEEFPELTVVINGGITSLDECEQHLTLVDGVMVGRHAYYQPYHLAEVDRRLYGAPGTHLTRLQAVEAMMPYIEEEMARGTPLFPLVRHMVGLYQGQPKARHWRQRLSEEGVRKGAPAGLILETARQMEEFRLDFEERRAQHQQTGLSTSTEAVKMRSSGSTT